MSLKAFHVFFIVLACGLMGVLGAWALQQGDSGLGWIAAPALVGAVGLVVYGVWFLRKTRGMSFL